MAGFEDKLATLRQALGMACHVIPDDATDLKAQKEAIWATAETFGGLNAAFANAGTGLDKQAARAATWRNGAS